jgi:aspartate kinase
LARNEGVPIHVRSSFTDEPGTWITKEETVTEKAIVAGVAHDTSEAKATLRGVPDQPGIAASIFKPLAAAGINIDMIVQNTSAEGITDVSFTLPKADLKRARPILDQVARDLGATVETDDGVARISLVGAGMKTHPGVAADMFDALAAAGINIEIISTSPIRISCVIRAAEIERAVRVVHERFKLHEPAVYEEKAMA